jgi:hypothetical protein
MTSISKQSIFIAIALVFLSLSAYAEDAITVRYLDGHPRLGVSSEWVSLRISRSGAMPGTAPASKQDIDRFFEAVSAALTTNKIAENWQLAIPDAPSIEITIDINGRKLQLTSCHLSLEQTGNYLVTERGGYAVPNQDRASMLAKETESFRQHRIGFEKILSLVLLRAHARLSP